jgi:hypothetical protein
MANVDKSIQARLQRLFSSKVIIRRLGKGKIKTIDMSNSQNAMSETSPVIDRFSRIHTNSYRSNGYASGDIRLAKLEYYKDYEAMDFDPHNYRFINEGTNLMGAVNTVDLLSKNTFENWEIAHFRLLSDTQFLPYGKSQIEPARKIYKQLSLMEDAMLLSRIMRAPERRVFKIQVGNLPTNEVDAYIDKIRNKTQKTPYIDETTGEYNLKFNLINMLEDYYIPVRGDKDGTEIDTLSGLDNRQTTEDLEYLRKKEFAALKIPPAFLGYDDSIGGKAVLSAEDIRFARTIERIQNVVADEFKKIAIVHLYIQGYRGEELANFSLSLNSPSIVYERQKVDLLAEKTRLADDLLRSKLVSRRWLHENIFNFTESDQQQVNKEVIEDQKLLFRYSQLESEGNDPSVTKQSFGTAHDLAALQMQMKQDGDEKKPEEDEDKPKAIPDEEETRGRDKEIGSIGTHKDVNGNDPDGTKQISRMTKVNKNDVRTDTKDKKPNSSNEVVIKALSKEFDRKKMALVEVFSEEKKPVEKTRTTLIDPDKIKTY